VNIYLIKLCKGLVMKRKARQESLDTVKGEMIGYARVSTDDQRLDLQLDALQKVGCLKIYQEHVSGAAKKRLQLDLAIKDLRPGDTLVVWRLDRLARTMRDLLHRMQAIEEAGARFRSLTEQFDTATAGGKFLIYVLGAVAELERQLTVERTQAGMASAKARGIKLGAREKMTPEKIKVAEKMLKRGASVADVAKRLEVATSSIYGHFWLRDGNVRRK
jgi:DNA invertase Pin-like site-specific DNA recombinase